LKLSLSDKTTVELNPIVCYKNDTHVQEVPFKQLKMAGGSSIFSIIANNLDQSMTRLCVIVVASDDELENIVCTDAPKINNVYTTVSTSLSNNNFLAGSVAPSSISVGKPVYIMLKLTKLASY
jgi:hypothetical protein